MDYSTQLDIGTRVRVRPLNDIHAFLHGARGTIVNPPTSQMARDRRLMSFDEAVTHPYGGVLRTLWVSPEMVEVLS